MKSNSKMGNVVKARKMKKRDNYSLIISKLREIELIYNNSPSLTKEQEKIIQTKLNKIVKQGSLNRDS